jgi:hypothetical protein
MALEIEDYVDVKLRMQQLGCRSTADLLVLPENFTDATSASDFRTSGLASTIIKVLRSGGISASLLESETSSAAFIHNKNHDWIVPAIYISSELLKTNPDLLSLAIDCIRDYALFLYKGIADKKTVKAEVVVEEAAGHTYKRVTYEGDVEGLRELLRAAKEIYGGNQGQ